jgi:HAD superfamily hydrolase (TIGR01509 family)
LVDSEAVVAPVVARLLADHGVMLSPEEILLRFTGVANPTMIELIEQESGIQLPDDFLTRLAARERDALDAQLRPVDGIAEVLDGIDGARCVASSSDLARVRRSLAIAGLSDYFDPDLFSASMVTNGKPAPDLFLHAATAMGQAPAACIVVEDSVPGVAAARAAGMAAVGFTGASHCRPGLADELRDAGAWDVAPDAPALASLLGALPPDGASAISLG